MPQTAEKGNFNRSVILFLSIVALGWIVFYLFTLPIGDDLNYNNVFSDYRGIGNGIYKSNPGGILSFWNYHCNAVNGRLANLYFVLSINFLPKWIVAVLSGVMVAVFIGLVLKVCGVTTVKNAGLSAFAIITFICLFFPWYDYFDILCVNYNYVWAAAAQLCAIVLIFSHPKKASWIYILISMIVCYIAGSFHEAGSSTLCVGLLYVLLMQQRQGKKTSTISAIMMFSYFVGAASVALAPGILRRLIASVRQPDSDPITLIIVSAPFVLIMICVYAISATTPKGRVRLRREMLSENAVWPIAAIASLPVIAAGGIIGRSGFFAQTYALIAIMQYWKPWKKYRINRRLAAVTSAAMMLLVAGLMTGLCIYHYKSYKAGKDIYTQYQNSPTGIVYYDQPDDDCLPFWAWSRIRNLHIEDAFTVYALKKYYKKEHRLTLLPLSAKNIKLERVDAPTTINLNGGGMIVGTLPKDAVMPDSTIWTEPEVGLTADGKRIIEPIHRENQPDIYYVGIRVQLFGE